MEDDVYKLTPQGWAMATEIFDRFANKGENIEAIAAHFDMEVPEIQVLMAMAFASA
jgi:hypothetical protein